MIDVPHDTEAPIRLFEFLCLRLKDIGIRSIHGVPGDFSLASLDYVKKCGLRWVGNCNELNAGYAADGYARVNGMSALMTVMGREHRCIHHTFGDGDFEVFRKMTAAAYCMSVTLDCPENAPAQINAAIRECWVQSRPVSIFIPSDLVSAPVHTDILTPAGNFDATPLNDMIAEGSVVREIISELQTAHNPVFLLGGHGVAHDVRHEILDLVHALQIPVLSSATGRGVIDEDHEQYIGLHVGDCSELCVIELMESVDLVLSIGNIQSDLGTAGFTGEIERKSLIDIQRNRTIIKEQPPKPLFIKGVLQTLIGRLDNSPDLGISANNSDNGNDEKQRHPQALTRPKEGNTMCPLRNIWTSICTSFMAPFAQNYPLRHDALWPAIGNWLHNGDVILAEAGTASFGMWKTCLPKDTTWISQYLWASIGYTVGACQGAALAVRDSGYRRRRTILFIGDGSLQIGCQELSTMVRLGLKPIIFVVCNQGYTIGRFVHGPDEPYNDIQPWDYRYLPAVYGATPDSYRFYRVRTMEHLENLLLRDSFKNPSVLQIVELHISSHDAPSTLVTVAQSLQRRNEQVE